MVHDRSAYSEQRRKQFMRQDAHRFIRPDAYRFMLPGSLRYNGKDVVRYFWPETDTNQPQEAAGRKDGRYRNTPAQDDRDADSERERRALRHEIAKFRLDWELFKFALKGQKAFNPDQPRVPAGGREGGRWTDGEGSTDFGGQRRRDGRGAGTPLQQQVRLELATARAQQALARVRDLDPNWRLPQSVTRSGSLEGTIRAKEAEAQAADARYLELLRGGSDPSDRALPRHSTGTPLRDVLTPGGEPIGVRDPGARAHVRTVSAAEFEEIRADLLRGAQLTNTPRSYPGVWYQRLDGTVVGLRPSRSGLAIDVIESNHPAIAPRFKVHQR